MELVIELVKAMICGSIAIVLFVVIVLTVALTFIGILHFAQIGNYIASISCLLGLGAELGALNYLGKIDEE